MSVTSRACPRCGRLDYPHVCLPIETATEPLRPILAHEAQGGGIKFEWVDMSDWIQLEGGSAARRGEAPVSTDIYVCAWGNNPRRAELKGRLCVIEARGAMRTVLVRFLDTGERVTTSARALRRKKCDHVWRYFEDKTCSYTGYLERCEKCGEIVQIPQ